MDEDEAIFGYDGIEFYIVLAAVTATLLLRTGAAALPTWLDFVVAAMFGGLALALGKLASHALREYILDILFNSGETSVERHADTQTITIKEHGDGVNLSGVKPGPPNIDGHMNAEFLVFGNKSVRIVGKERDALLRAVADAQRKRDADTVYLHGPLVMKLTNLGLSTKSGRWTPDGAELFNIEFLDSSPVDDRPLEDYDFVPGTNGEYEHDLHPENTLV